MTGQGISGNDAKKQRSSNIELLRIVSMLLIISHHYFLHGKWDVGSSFLLNGAVDVFCLGGKLGVSCFVLITGYFMVRSHFKTRSFARVVLQTWFYSFGILAVFLLVKPGAISGSYFPKGAMPVLSGQYWFVTAYIGLTLFAPAINRLLLSLGNTGRHRLSLVSIVALSLLPTISNQGFLFSNFAWFCCLYLLGANAWLYEKDGDSELVKGAALDPVLLCRRAHPAAVAGVALACVVVLTLVVDYCKLRLGLEFYSSRFFQSVNALPMVFLSVGLFECFRRLDIGSIKAVNVLASTAFGVYLIHDNPLVRGLLWKQFGFAWQAGLLPFVGMSLVAAVAIYLACSAIDLLRQILLEKPLFGLIEKAFSKKLDAIDNWFRAIG